MNLCELHFLRTKCYATCSGCSGKFDWQAGFCYLSGNPFKLSDNKLRELASLPWGERWLWRYLWLHWLLTYLLWSSSVLHNIPALRFNVETEGVVHTSAHVWAHVWAGTSPFAETVRKLVHTKPGFKQKCVVVGTACRSSAHDAALKMAIVLSQLLDSRIQTNWISCNMLPGQNLVLTTELFRKNGPVTRGKLSF